MKPELLLLDLPWQVLFHFVVQPLCGVVSIHASFNELIKKKHAQFFTPADFALYSAIEFYRNQKFPRPVMDPCSGLGSPLIASGFILAEQFELRGKDLLNHIYGNEIDSETRLESIKNIINSLKDYLLPEITLTEARTILNKNISLCDANSVSLRKLSNCAIIVNPPYKEESTSNVWIPIIQRILEFKPKAFTFILPVSISSSVRTERIREFLKSHYDIKAPHHEIRPRPLFKNVDQRISILTGFFNLNDDRIYETTGFLTHKAGNRSSVWMEETISHPMTAISSNVFPKISSEDEKFYQECVHSATRKTLENYSSGVLADDLIEIYIRTTGRYRLLAQCSQPEEMTSKWKTLQIPKTLEDKFLQAFNGGDLLRWWKIFGDGRDISIRAIQSSYRF